MQNDPVLVKPKAREQKYLKAWEEIPAFKEWLTCVPINDRSAFCKFCRVVLKAHRNDLKKHLKSKKHTLRTLEAMQNKLSLAKLEKDEDDQDKDYDYFGNDLKSKVKGFKDKNAEDVWGLLQGLLVPNRRKGGKALSKKPTKKKKQYTYMTPKLKKKREMEHFMEEKVFANGGSTDERNDATCLRDGRPESVCTPGTQVTQRYIPQVQHQSSFSSNDYLLQAEFFMAQAFLSSKCCQIAALQGGACIVDSENRIVGVGHNSFPVGCSSEEFPEEDDHSSSINSRASYVCHAEMNAIVNRTVPSLKECTMYVTKIPCPECVKIMIQSGIKEVFFPFSQRRSCSADMEISKRLMDTAKMKYWQLKLLRKQVVLNLEDLDGEGEVEAEEEEYVMQQETEQEETTTEADVQVLTLVNVTEDTNISSIQELE